MIILTLNRSLVFLLSYPEFRIVNLQVLFAEFVVISVWALILSTLRRGKVKMKNSLHTIRIANSENTFIGSQ